MNSPESKRRWLFSVTDFDDDEVYVDESGGDVSQDDAKEFIGTDREASAESERRSNLWEDKNMTLVNQATRHSRGIVT